MATLEQVVQFTISVLGETQRRIGQKTSPVEFTVGGAIFDTGNITVADAFGRANLWAVSQGGLTTFSYLIFTTNADIILELGNTVDASTDARALFRIAANSFFVLPSAVMGGYTSDTSRLDGAVLVANTDYFNIDFVRVQRDVADLAGDALIRLVLIA